jgi:uncharacterized protein with ParB-like and HNH nuclease domain
MKNKNQTIRKIVSFLNNAEEDGGFWLPNIQRPFVWSEDQICRLFDSIMREYPISTLLIWKTTSVIRRRKFIDKWKNSLSLSSFYELEDKKKKNLVLDGQQRLQSLFIGLRGSYEGNELYFDILSGKCLSPDDIKYKFNFLNPKEAVFPWVKFKDLVFTAARTKREELDQIRKYANRSLSSEEEDKIEDHLDLIVRNFNSNEVVSYQELDSIDNPNLYTEDDVVEVFIRANSGGTKLSKSDLLFSLLGASWEGADQQMEDLLGDLNKHGFAFNRDFILKTCLVLLDQGARYEVSKFRKTGMREDIKTKWDNISDSIRDVVDFIRSKTYIRCDKALPSHLALIPLIYVRYHFSESWKKAVKVDDYLLRTLLVGAFSGQSDNLIDVLVKKFKEIKEFNLEKAFDVIRDQNRSLKLTEERFWQMGYGSKTIHLLLNIWYSNFSYVPAYDNNLPQVDHIFPRSRLKKIKVLNQDTGYQAAKYKDDICDQLANCMLLTREENGAGGKSDIPPAQWFSDKSSDYFKIHLVPENPELWEMDRYEDFIEARKNLIRDRFKSFLVSRV